jgi:mortality factor 4-like protein 1
VDAVHGIKMFFERTLPYRLLYNFERPQYEALIKEKGPDVELCAHYGAEHLGRLFVKIPELLAETQLWGAELTLLQQKVKEMIAFLPKRHLLFKQDIMHTDEAYQQSVIDVN